MQQDEIAAMLLSNETLPKDLAETIKSGKAKLMVTQIIRTRALALYQIRLEHIKQFPEYDAIAVALSKVLDYLATSSDEKIWMAGIIDATHFVNVFITDDKSNIVGVLDYTGLGNTKAFMIDATV